MVQSQEKLPQTSQNESKLTKITENPIDLNCSKLLNRLKFIKI